MKFRKTLALVSIGMLALACDGPTAGELTVDLVTPSSTDGAIFFKVEAAASKTVTSIAAACSDCGILTHTVSDSELYGVVTGQLGPGPLVTLTVSDVGSPDAYTLTILEIAGRDRRLRSSTGYELNFAR